MKSLRKMNNNLYVEIDPKNQIILSCPKELELNWNNIGGLSFLSDDQLYDLSWAGYENSGFIKFDKENRNALRCFTCEPSLIEQIKSELKLKLSEIRYNYECSGVIVNDEYTLNTNDRSKILMQIKYLECKECDDLNFIWKTSSGKVEFTSSTFIKVFKKIREFIQKSFDLEVTICNNIDNCNDIISLVSINLNEIEWNSNQITI